MHLQDWLDEVQKLTTDDPIKMVIANKNDLDVKKVSESDMQVSTSIYVVISNKNFTEQTGIEIITASAKKSININNVFEQMTAKLLEKQ